MSRQDEVDNETPPGVDADAQDQENTYDPLAALTVAEVRVASRELGADLVTSITGKTEHYSEALARLLWMHRRRADRTKNPDELWRQIDGMTFKQLQDELGDLAPAGEGSDPTQPQS